MYILHQIFPQKTKILNLRYFDQSACIAIKQQNDFVSKGANHFPGPPEKAACFNPSICLAALTKIYLHNLFIVKPWSKSKSGPLSQQDPKLNKSPLKKEKRRILTKG